MFRHKATIYNSRNYSILLNFDILDGLDNIYNSRNYSILLNSTTKAITRSRIYNSRNYSILLNDRIEIISLRSTTVEIILYYLTYYVKTTIFYLQQ